MLFVICFFMAGILCNAVTASGVIDVIRLQRDAEQIGNQRNREIAIAGMQPSLKKIDEYKAKLQQATTSKMVNEILKEKNAFIQQLQTNMATMNELILKGTFGASTEQLSKMLSTLTTKIIELEKYAREIDALFKLHWADFYYGFIEPQAGNRLWDAALQEFEKEEISALSKRQAGISKMKKALEKIVTNIQNASQSKYHQYYASLPWQLQTLFFTCEGEKCAIQNDKLEPYIYKIKKMIERTDVLLKKIKASKSEAKSAQPA